MNAQMSIPGVQPSPSAELSQWFTDPVLARRIVEWANIAPGDLVLEPSAGSGAFVQPLVDVGALVTAVEYDPSWAAHLKGQYPTETVWSGDFTAWIPPHRFDLAVMNPPYENEQDLGHVVSACGMSDRVVALLRTVFLHGVARHDQVWRAHHPRRIVHLSRRPRFSGAGSPRHDFSVMELTPRSHPCEMTEVGWWT